MGFLSAAMPMIGMVGGLMTQAAGVGISTAAARQQAEAENLSRQWNAAMAREQAAVSRAQAENARQRGNIAASEARIQYKQLQGQQRAAYGASGVNVNTGSAALVQADTSAWSVYAQQKELYNYGMEAWGYEQNARLQEFDAERQLAVKSNPNFAAATAAISGGTGLFNTMTRWKAS